MKKLALLLLVLAAPMLAQTPIPSACDQMVYDPWNILGAQSAQVMAAAGKLANQGADPRVIVDESSDTADQYVGFLTKRCASWQSASGGVKNNLMVFVVFPQHRKFGLFVGPEFGKSIQASGIRTQYMAPAFRDKDFARGLVNGLSQATIQIQARNEAALHPAVNAATDLTGLWHVLGWIVALAALGCLIGLLIWYLRRNEAAKDAQQAAVNARNDVAHRLQVALGWLQIKEALKVDVSQQRQVYDTVAEDFARISESETYNPETNKLTPFQYSKMQQRFERMLLDLAAVSQREARPRIPHHRYSDTSSKADQPSGSPATTQGPAATPISEPVTYMSSSSNMIYAPVTIIEDEPYRPRESYSHYTQSEPVSSGWSGSSSSNDFGSDSGSFSDSSSSSDFGSDSGFSGGSDSF